MSTFDIAGSLKLIEHEGAYNCAPLFVFDTSFTFSDKSLLFFCESCDVLSPLLSAVFHLVFSMSSTAFDPFF